MNLHQFKDLRRGIEWNCLEDLLGCDTNDVMLFEG